MAPSFRRIVTRLGDDGLSRIHRIEELEPNPDPAAALPAEIRDRSYPDGAPWNRVVWDCEALPPELPADSDWHPSFTLPGSGGARVSITGYPPGWTGQMMWSSRVDILWIVSGALTYVTDGGDAVVLRPGDFLIQNGTNKTMSNHGSEVVYLGAIMFGAVQTGPIPTMDNFHGNPADIHFRQE